MKTTDHPRLLQHLLVLACITALTVSCTGYIGDSSTEEPSPDAPMMEVDPTGNWNLTYMFSAGCGQPATVAMTTFTVTRTANGYAVADAGAMVSGTLICTANNCKLSGTFAWTASGSQFQQNANISLDVHGNITGNGTESAVTATLTCSFAFTTQGTRI